MSEDMQKDLDAMQNKKENDKVLAEKVEFLQVENEDLKAKLAEADKKALRLVADYHNLQMVNEREVAKVRSYAVSNFATDIITFVDDLDRMLQNVKEEEKEMHFVKAAKLFYANILKILKKHDIEPIISQIGDAFDYNIHNVFSREKHEDLPSESIVKIIAKGYKLKDRVLRHELVIISE